MRPPDGPPASLPPSPSPLFILTFPVIFIYSCPVIKTKKDWFMKFFLCVVGMVLIIEGLPYFGFPDKMKTMMEKLREIPDGSLRVFGFALMLLGLFLVYIGKA